MKQCYYTVFITPRCHCTSATITLTHCGLEDTAPTGASTTWLHWSTTPIPTDRQQCVSERGRRPWQSASPAARTTTATSKRVGHKVGRMSRVDSVQPSRHHCRHIRSTVHTRMQHQFKLNFVLHAASPSKDSIIIIIIIIIIKMGRKISSTSGDEREAAFLFSREFRRWCNATTLSCYMTPCQAWLHVLMICTQFYFI